MLSLSSLTSKCSYLPLALFFFVEEVSAGHLYSAILESPKFIILTGD
jgi:hypothetical protein